MMALLHRSTNNLYEKNGKNPRHQARTNNGEAVRSQGSTALRDFAGPVYATDCHISKENKLA